MKLLWLAVVPLLLASGAKSTSHDLDLVKPLTIGGKLQQIIGEIINLPVHFAETAINAFNEFIQSLDDPQDREVWQETSKDIIADVGSALSKSIELLPKIPSILEKASSCMRNAVANIKAAVLRIVDVLPMLQKTLLNSLIDILKLVYETLMESLQLVFTFKKCPSIYCKITSLIDIFRFAQKKIGALIETTKTSINNIISVFKKVIGNVVDGVIESMQQLQKCFIEDNALQAAQTTLGLSSRSISTELEEIIQSLFVILNELIETIVNRINNLNNDLSTGGQEELAKCIQTIGTELNKIINDLRKTPDKLKNLLKKVKDCFNFHKWWHGTIGGILANIIRLQSCRTNLEKKLNNIKKEANEEISKYKSLQENCLKLKYKEICSIGVATNIPATLKSIGEIIIAGLLETPSNIKVFVQCFIKEGSGLLNKLVKFFKAIDECVK